MAELVNHGPQNMMSGHVHVWHIQLTLYAMSAAVFEINVFYKMFQEIWGVVFVVVAFQNNISFSVSWM